MVSRRLLVVAAILMLSGCATTAVVPGTPICDDGRLAVNPNEVAIQYSRIGFTLSAGVKNLAVTIGIKPEQVQKAEEGTQHWDKFIQGAALAHNGCSGTKDRFSNLLQRYLEVKAAKEAIEALLNKVPPDGKVSDQLRDAVKHAFDRYFELMGDAGSLIQRIDRVATGDSYKNEGQYTLAISEYEQAIADGPPSAALYRKLGIAQALASRVAREAEVADYQQKAIKSFLRCLEVDPHLLRCRINIALVKLEGATRYGDAVREAEAILDSLWEEQMTEAEKAYVSYYQGYIALLNGDNKTAKRVMFETLESTAVTDAFLKTFAHYNLAVANCYLSLTWGQSPDEVRRLKEEAVEHLLRAARVAEYGPLDVKSKLRRWFRNQQDRHFQPIKEHPQWKKIVEEIDSL